MDLLHGFATVLSPTNLVYALIGVMLFDPASHWLRYDGDGAGQDSAVDVAFLPGVSHLTASDFFFV